MGKSVIDERHTISFGLKVYDRFIDLPKIRIE